jgi:hypothetical protein
MQFFDPPNIEDCDERYCTLLQYPLITEFWELYILLLDPDKTEELQEHLTLFV